MDPLSQEQIARLTPPERLALISQLWDSLDADEFPLSASQQAELDRRLESLDQDRREGVEWKTLRAELERRSQ
jgi:putative addiction module component (TIGR02574 family)